MHTCHATNVSCRLPYRLGLPHHPNGPVPCRASAEPGQGVGSVGIRACRSAIRASGCTRPATSGAFRTACERVSATNLRTARRFAAAEGCSYAQVRAEGGVQHVCGDRISGLHRAGRCRRDCCAPNAKPHVRRLPVQSARSALWYAYCDYQAHVNASQPRVLEVLSGLSWTLLLHRCCSCRLCLPERGGLAHCLQTPQCGAGSGCWFVRGEWDLERSFVIRQD